MSQTPGQRVDGSHSALRLARFRPRHLNGALRHVRDHGLAAVVALVGLQRGRQEVVPVDEGGLASPAEAG